MGLKTKVGPGNRASINSATEAIPRNTKGNGKRGGGSPAAASSATRGGDANDAEGGGCALCKKYSTNSQHAWKTHSTKDCKRYNKDGTTKPFEFGNSRNSVPYDGKRVHLLTLKRKQSLSIKKSKI